MESKPGDYMYRICATTDGKNFSEDTWTLTLHVKENSTYDFNFLFCVGKDYNGNYPILKLYNVVKDASGKEVLGDELKNCFLYSNYTSTLPDGETEWRTIFSVFIPICPAAAMPTVPLAITRRLRLMTFLWAA